MLPVTCYHEAAAATEPVGTYLQGKAGDAAPRDPRMSFLAGIVCPYPALVGTRGMKSPRSAWQRSRDAAMATNLLSITPIISVQGSCLLEWF